MDRVPFPIAVFPQDGRLWRIVWFGRVEINPGLPSEPRIQVLLAPLPDVPPADVDVSHLSDRQALAHVKVAPVGVGLLPLLTIGSVWRNGLKVAEPVYIAKTFRKVPVNENTMRVVSSGHAFPWPGGARRYLLPEFAYPIGTEAGLAAKCVVLPVGDDPWGLVIPAVEAIRFYFGSSSQLIAALFRGGLVGSGDLLFDPKRSFPSVGGAYRLQLRAGIPDQSARSVATIAAAPTTRKRAAGIHDSLIKSGENTRLAVPEMLVPFDGEASFKVHGTWIASGGKKRFLALRIAAADFPFPHREVLLYRDNDGRGDGIEDHDRPEAFRGVARPLERSAGKDDGGAIRNDWEPRLDTPDTVVCLDDSRFLNPVGVTKPPKGQCAHRAPVVGLKAPEEPPEDLSTGGGTWGESDRRRLVIKRGQGREEGAEEAKPDRERRRETIPPGFESLKSVLEILCAEGGFSYAIETGAPMPFPTRVPDGALKWSYMGRRAGEVRRALVVKIVARGAAFYAMEIERKADWERFSVLLAHSQNLLPLGREAINGVLLHCAMNKGVWLRPSDLTEIERRKFTHGHKSPESLAVAMKRYMEAEAKSAGRTQGMAA